MMSCRGGEVVVSKPQATPASPPSPPLCEQENNPWGRSFNGLGGNMKGSEERRLVCLTGGNFYLGSHILKQLLARGYLVRLALQHPVEVEEMMMKLKGGGMDEEVGVGLESVVVGKLGDVDSLCRAFTGCCAVFHTSSSFDPHGVSGYSETMAFLETEGAKNVIEACGRTACVKRCIFTSSLLASIWQANVANAVIDESCWSDEEFCRDNKLWLALGKTTAEKITWRKSKEMKVNLATICPALVMAPTFPNAHTEASLPYLKGGQVMIEQGVLATVDVDTAAKAHVDVYEAMDYGACGRYLCFDRVVKRLDEVIDLENGLKMHGLLSRGRNALSNHVEDEESDQGPLSNAKLAKLVSYASQHVSCNQ
ncbi:cinnamoyl-CoA reductase-like SNL6 [Macadamia integrifolia]|uniref:cinnamoyl-CoA reductase-like SNL6 n=1 Tax=Macadamia integrifolia TaxID=60698 RepID=UPI001C4FC63E|nr:cinnamoyl-CoA reductase-like SNL6 [Macadamia integrifolia]